MRTTDQSQVAVSVRAGKKHESLVQLPKLFFPILLFRHGEFITDVACLPFSGTYLFSDVLFPLLFLILHCLIACLHMMKKPRRKKYSGFVVTIQKLTL